MRRRNWTLGRALSLALLGLGLVVALLLGLLLRRWGDSLLAASQRLREAASRSAEALITRTLGGAEAALEDVDKQARSRVLNIDDPLSVEGGLLAVLLGNEDLSEVTLTRARKIADDPEPRFAVEGRWQVSVYRDGTAASIITCYSHQEGGEIVSDFRRRSPGPLAFQAVPFTRADAKGSDPTDHPTFATTVSLRGHSALPLWTDLHYAELDEGLPAARQRVVVTVMKILEGGSGQFAGVIRVGLLVSRLEEVTRLRVDERDPQDPHRVFVADGKGRLILRMRPDERYEDQDGDVRPAAGLVSDELRVPWRIPR